MTSLLNRLRGRPVLRWRCASLLACSPSGGSLRPNRGVGSRPEAAYAMCGVLRLMSAYLKARGQRLRAPVPPAHRWRSAHYDAA